MIRKRSAAAAALGALGAAFLVTSASSGAAPAKARRAPPPIPACLPIATAAATASLNAAARAYDEFDKKEWRAAAIDFRYLAFHPQGGELTGASESYAADRAETARLYLESVNHLGLDAAESSAAAAACFFDAVEADVPKLRALHCVSSSSSSSCAFLDDVQVDIDRLEAQKLVEAADKLGRQDNASVPLYERGAIAYRRIFQTFCAARPSSASLSLVRSRQCEEVAYNSARAFESTPLKSEALAMLQALRALHPDAPLSLLARRAEHDIARMQQRFGDKEKAADLFEAFVRAGSALSSLRSPIDDDYLWRDALTVAIGLRIDLDQLDKARADLEVLTRAQRGGGYHQHDRELVDMHAQVAAAFDAKGDVRTAAAIVSTTLPLLEQGHGTPKSMLRSYEMLERAHPKLAQRNKIRALRELISMTTPTTTGDER